jgi:thiamine biosynthesis lipoprotein
MVFVSCDAASGGQTVEAQNVDFSMGTAITSTLYGRNEAVLEENLAEISQCLSTVDAEISWRQEDSLVDVFNKQHEVSVEGREEVFQLALEIAKESGGAFDPTILSVSKLWDIGGENQRHPSQSEIDEAMKAVDYQAVTLSDGVLTTDNTDTLFELGAIGKGYAIEQAAQVIDRENISGGIISAGSSILIFGTKPDGSKFRVALRDPRGEQDDRIGVITLTDLSISTSGDYEKYFEEDGVRYHHILDARTGYPADSGLMSVTVIAENSTLCDALSTAGFILGLDEGMALMNKYEVIAIFVDNQRNVYYNNEDVLEMLSFEGESDGYTLKAY